MLSNVSDPSHLGQDTKSVLKAKKNKRKAFIKARETGLYCHKTLWEQQSQLVKSMLIKAKADYENKLLDLVKTEPMKFCNYARHYFRSFSIDGQG